MTKVIVRPRSARSPAITRKPPRSEEKNGSCPSSSWATDLPCSSLTFIFDTATAAIAKNTAVTMNDAIGPLHSMQAAPIAGPTIQPIANNPSCRPFAASTLTPDAVAAFGISDLRAV